MTPPTKDPSLRMLLEGHCGLLRLKATAQSQMPWLSGGELKNQSSTGPWPRLWFSLRIGPVGGDRRQRGGAGDGAGRGMVVSEGQRRSQSLPLVTAEQEQCLQRERTVGWKRDGHRGEEAETQLFTGLLGCLTKCIHALDLVVLCAFRSGPLTALSR